MEEDKIKEAFGRAKQDIQELKDGFYYLSQNIEEIKRTLQILAEQPTNQQTNQHPIPAEDPQNQAFQHIPTHEIPYNPLKQPFTSTSTRNDGVPTNQPTNQQTNQHPSISYGNISTNNTETLKISQNIDKKDKISHLERVSEILSSLDGLKKDIRTKFKKLTPQEMLVFSAIYQLEEQGFIVDYSLLSQKLSLTEISIRDYVRKLLEKGIPLSKIKENNKKIQLSVAQDLRKIASLDTILALRDL